MGKVGILRTLAGGRVAFFCPGCKEYHQIVIEKNQWNEQVWGFNGDYEKPTFEPSINVELRGGPNRCHSFVRNGMIEFLSDSTHELAGKTVEIPSHGDEADGE